MSLRSRLVPSLLRHHAGFRRFWLAQTISLLGDQVTLIALPLVAVIVLDATPAQMGYLTAAALLPNLLFSLHAGALVDRRGHRRDVMIAADVSRGLLLALVPLSAALGVLSLTALYVIAFLVGVSAVLFTVASQALFVALVPRHAYVGAMSLLSGTRSLSQVAGGSAGGVLVQALTAPLAVLVDAVSYLFSALLLARMKVIEPAREESARGLVLGGVRWIAGSPIVRSALGATATINFFNFGFFALFVLYVTRSLGVSPAALGLVLSAGALGGVLGALVTGRVVRRLGVGPTFVLGCVLFPAPLLLVPLAGGPAALVLSALVAAEFGAGFGVMLLDIAIGAVFAVVIPDRLRSRVSGAYMLVNYGMRPLGAFAAGALAGAIGIRGALWVATAGGLLGVLWLVPSPLPKLRELPPSDDGEPARAVLGRRQRAGAAPSGRCGTTAPAP
jgi:MFS family permease